MKSIDKPAYVFTHNAYDGTVTTISLKSDGASIEDLLETFLNFLRGCSFIIDSGASVEYIPAEVKVETDKEILEEELRLYHASGKKKKKKRSKK